MATVSGKCACGDVEMSVEGEAAGPYQCFCYQCRQASGGGPATFVMTPKDSVKITGRIASFEASTLSGNEASRSFCPRCGTAVYSEPAKSVGMLAVKLSMFDSPPWSTIKAVFWMCEKPAWSEPPSGARQFDSQP